MSQERIVEKAIELATPLATELGYELVDVEYRKEGPNWILRCFIDCETGVGINECQRFSEALDQVLDAADPIPGSYLLEVSSPGLERPLKKDGDFVRFAGNMVEIRLRQPIDGKKTLIGILSGVRQAENSKSFKVVIDNAGQVTEIPRDIITKAKLVEEIFNPKKGGIKKK